MMATDPASMGTTAKTWTLKQQTNTSWQSGANGFGLFDATLTYLNTQGSTLKYWGSFDQGSTYWVEAVPDNYASNVEAEVKPWFDNYGSYFQLKTSVVEANQTKYEAALVNCDLATYQQLLGLLDEPDNYVYPSTGFYRIKSIGARAVGESYIAFLRENIFKPLGMEHTGSVDELDSSPEWAKGLLLRADGYECDFYMKQ